MKLKILYHSIIRFTSYTNLFIVITLVNLLFSCGKIDEVQSVVVTERITTNTTWKAENVYIIKGTIDIYNTTLTIEPGTTIKFESGASLRIGQNGSTNSSTLVANGTADKPITFTSAASNPSAGNWEGIQFYRYSYNNSMKYCTIQYAGTASKGAIYLYNTSIAFSNNHILDAIANGIILEWDASFSEMNNNVIEKCGNHPISMAACKVNTIGTGNVFNCPDGKGVLIKDGISNITASNTWKNLNKPYYVEDLLDVQEGTLTIEPGTIIKFESGASLRIGQYGSTNSSTLVANGTADKPITFTSAASNPSAGNWEGIQFYRYSYNNSMKYCTIQYAGTASKGAIYLYNTSFAFSNNHILDAIANGIILEWDASFSEMNNNVIEKCGNHPISMAACKVNTIGTGNVFNCPDGKGILIKDGISNITASNTWKNLNKPYYVEDDLDVQDGTLTIEPGTIIKFKPSASLRIGQYGSTNSSTLVANGTADKPIEFTSAALTPVAGNWEGIQFYRYSYNNSMKYCYIHYAGGVTNRESGAIAAYSAIFSVNNCLITNSSAWGISYDSRSTYTGNNNTFLLCAVGDVSY